MEVWALNVIKEDSEVLDVKYIDYNKVRILAH